MLRVLALGKVITSSRKSRCVTAVDRDHAARRRSRLGEVSERLRDVEARDLAREQIRAEVFVHRQASRGRARFEDAAREDARADPIGIHGIRTHPMARLIERVLAHETDERRLRDGIRTESRPRCERRLARIEEEAPTSPFELPYLARLRGDGVVRSEIDIHRALQRRCAVVRLEATFCGDARVADDDVDTAERVIRDVEDLCSSL